MASKRRPSSIATCLASDRAERIGSDGRRRGERSGGPAELLAHELERPEQLVHRLEPVRALLRHAPQHDGLELCVDGEVGAELPRGHWRLVQVLQDDVHGAHRRERHLAGEHLVEQDAQRIEVAALIGALVAGLLRRDVVRRPHEGAGIGDLTVRVVAVEELHQAEVEHLDEVVIVVLPQEHDVGRLQVAVDDPQRMRLSQRAADLLRHVDDALLRERALLLHRLRQRAAVEELHGDEEDAVLGAPVVVEGDGVGVRQPGGDRRLEEEALVEIGIAVVAGAEDLEGHHPVERRLQRLVDAAHATLPDRLDDAVPIVDGAPDQRIGLGRGRRVRRGRGAHAGQFTLDHHSTEGQTSGLSIAGEQM